MAGAADVVAAAALPLPGEQVGSYVVERLLARGGMGAVYVARDAANRRVALKVMLEGGATAAARFEREGRAVARLSHPGVVRVHDLGQSGGRAYLVMDLVPGESLHARLERAGPLPFDEAARLTVEVARAVAHAHERGVLHRDLKPHNVLLTPDGRPVVTDFGLARVEDQSRALTRSGASLGTPAYMPPEQARGAVARIGPASDVYGLGATLFAMLTGDAPFKGDSLIEVMVKVLGVEAEAPSSLRPGVPPGLDAICLTCLQKEPADRYPTAEDLARDLERWLEGGDVDPLRRARGRRRARRLRLVAASLAGAVGLAASVVGVVVATRDAPSPRPAPPAVASEPSPADDEDLALADDVARDLTLPASGELSLPLEVRPGVSAVVLRLRPTVASGAWRLAVDDPAGAELARTAAGATPGEEGDDRALALTADAALPLRTGAHTLRVGGPAGGRAALTLRMHASTQDALGEPFVDALPLPPLDELFAPERRESAARLARRLDPSVREDEVEWLDDALAPTLESGTSDALDGLDALAAQEDTPRASVVMVIRRARLSGNTDAVWRMLAARVRGAAEELRGVPEGAYALGRVALAERRHDEAGRWLAQVVSLEPRALDARLLLARSELARGAHGEADACARAVLARDPRQPAAAGILGQVELAHEPPRWELAVPLLLFAAERSGSISNVNLLYRLMQRVRATAKGDPGAQRAARRVVDYLAPTAREDLTARFGVAALGIARLEIIRGQAQAYAGDVAQGLAHLRGLAAELERTRDEGVTSQRRPLRDAIAELERLPR